MSRGAYDPPNAPVVDPVVERPAARWKWLFVPFGHATLTFFFMVAWSRLAPRPAEAPPAYWALDAFTAWWMVKDALFQGGILLGIAVVLLWALPRIHLRQAAYVALASAAATFMVDLADAYLRGTITNGEYLDRTVVTCALVLLLSGVIIRRSRSSVA
jgi:hypothetical protein